MWRANRFDNFDIRSPELLARNWKPLERSPRTLLKRRKETLFQMAPRTNSHSIESHDRAKGNLFARPTMISGIGRNNSTEADINSRVGRRGDSLPAYRRSLTKLDKWGKEWGRASGKGVVVVTTLARRHVPRCNLAGDKGGVRWNKAPRWLAGKETSFSYIRGHGQTTSFITHWPFDHRNTLAIRPTVRASFPLSPPPLFRSISTTAFNRSRPPRVRPPRWTKKKKTHHPCFIHRIFSNRFDYSRPISRGIREGKERFEDYYFFFFFFFSFLRFVELLRSMSTPGNQADTVVFVSRNPIPQIQGSNRSSSIRADFSTTRGKERQGKLFSFPRRFWGYTEILEDYINFYYF